MIRVSRQTFSTAARVHPNIVPHLRPPRGKMSLGWVKPVAAVLLVGYGVKSYIEMAHQLRMAQIQLMERENTALKERNEMLMNLYGDRSSLNNVQKAVEFYEKR
ncbi:Fc.00g070450.m01.CDS01 [Cosmosporella sp. VM-42]